MRSQSVPTRDSSLSARLWKGQTLASPPLSAAPSQWNNGVISGQEERLCPRRPLPLLQARGLYRRGGPNELSLGLNCTNGSGLVSYSAVLAAKWTECVYAAHAHMLTYTRTLLPALPEVSSLVLI